VHADWLAAAVDVGLPGRRPMQEALAEYGRGRDEEMLPMYEFSCALAPFAPPSPELAQLLGSSHCSAIPCAQSSSSASWRA
jgi:hypothetical protein